ncbi:hypothetical protein pb186bvf_019371 [Paramecium bursaria]
MSNQPDSTSSNKDKNLPRQYTHITQEKRIDFLKDVIKNNVSIIKAARRHQIKVSTAKVIVKKFKEKGKIGKQRIPDNLNPQQEDQISQYLNNCQQLQSQLEILKQKNAQLEYFIKTQQLNQYYRMQYQIFFRFIAYTRTVRTHDIMNKKFIQQLSITELNQKKLQDNNTKG